jgi:hypothetical protein
MALTWDQISGITEKKFVKKLADNIFDSNPLLKRLKEKSYEKLDGGTSIMVPLNYAQTTASGWYAGSDTLSTADNESITSAEYAWKQIYANITITRKDELMNSGDSQKISLVKSKVQIAEKTIMDLMGTAIYNDGTTLNALVGLRAIVGTSSTVGGISQSSYSWWNGQVDSSTSTLTIGALQTMYNASTVDNDAPTVIMATRANYNRFYGLLQPQQRFQDSETAKAGFSSLMFNGSPFISDSHCPTNHIFMLNEKYLHLFAHKDEDMRFEPFQKPINQNVKVGKVYWMGALGSSNNRLHAKLSAVAA